MHAHPRLWWTDVPTSFRRQVVLRIDADDWSLLEDAAREHGSQQAALMEGLRALRRLKDSPPIESLGPPRAAAQEGQQETPSRLLEQENGDSAPTPKPRRRHKQPPTVASEGWWIPLSEARQILGLEGAALRRRIKDSAAATRRDAGNEDEVRLDQIQVDTSHGAHLLGVGLETMRRHGQDGDMDALERGGRYYFPLGALEINVTGAADYLQISPAAVRGRIDRGELPHRRDDHGRRQIPLLDVISQL
jgi:hypothetical protein